MKYLLLLSLLFSCSPEQASRIGYNLGQGLVGSINKNQYIEENGRKYYKTLNCRDYGYLDGNYEPIEVFECITIKEAHYVAFEAGASIIYIILL